MSTFLGILSGTGLLFYAIVKQGGFMIFVNPPALMIVMGGTLAAIFISFPLPRVLKVVQAALQVFRRDVEKPLWAIAMIVRLAVKARQKSLISLEKEMKTVKNRFLKMGLEMVIDGQPGDIIRDVLETESDFIQIRHRSGAHIFQTSGRFSPAFGLIGTLIGLVAMMRGLGAAGDDASRQLGQGMAVALLTTFYGAMMANLFFFPIAEKLRSRSEDESLTTRIIIEGILMIQAGINPRMIERKLNSFLPPHLRAKHFDRIVKKGKAKAKPLSEETFAPATGGEVAVAGGEDDF
ncbi:MAG: MotA/TolQ/ExbB proton channel family protein [Nitrospinota bacterium]|jgi:chemotaxis protein MotA|nr:MotA/TolQ/ExbB proton channel family protein [Nitrospinota bacterium]